MTAATLVTLVNMAHSFAGRGLRRDPPEDRFATHGAHSLQNLADKYAPHLARYHSLQDWDKFRRSAAAFAVEGSQREIYWEDQREALADALTPILLAYGFCVSEDVACDARAVLYSKLGHAEQVGDLSRLLRSRFAVPCPR